MILKLSKFLDHLFSKEVFQKFSRDRSITLRFPFLFFSSFSFLINFRPLCRYANRTIRAEMESDLLNAATSIHGPIFIRAGESHRFHFWQWPLPKL